MFLKEEDKKVEKDLPYKILKSVEIQKVFKNSNSFKNGVFLAKHIQSDSFGYQVTFSKKLKLSKPQKNKIKRQIRSIILENIQTYSNLDFHLVLILLELDKSNKLDYKELKINVLNLLNQLNHG